MQVSRTELTLNPAKGIRIAPLGFRATPSRNWLTAESGRKSQLSRLGSTEKVEKGRPQQGVVAPGRRNSEEADFLYEEKGET
jgi:hypothetical protein